ncbi:N-acetylglucosaminyl-phosphatidylinositol de-N-acetylase [Amphibalanus amphitrite]|uniref:N-acetylglucosaminylphosphatidylinositol deacetylase n=1 Tax=Amphibalanus amphitrite TaxID=1232801 RepID=A0A6A4WVE5_AMPAM|nr:N-acetylglucosaminyl-phosphatidylinositol de-N-acetylase [Amphibalanus amphitrite]
MLDLTSLSMALIALGFTVYLLSAEWCRRRRHWGPLGAARRALIVTAHPDDECMFFGPTVVGLLRQPGCLVYLLCLSTGDYDGRGKVRKEELYRSCQVLGIKRENVILLRHSRLPDHPGRSWNDALVSELILQHVMSLDIDTVVSFDPHGVSYHRNHRSCFYGLLHLLREGRLPTECAVYCVPTVNLLRKFSSFLDVPLTLLTSEVVSLVSLDEWSRIQHAMGQHRSQIVWFRVLYMLFSRYVFINSLERLQVAPADRRTNSADLKHTPLERRGRRSASSPDSSPDPEPDPDHPSVTPGSVAASEWLESTADGVLDLELEPILSGKDFPTVVHGTYFKCLDSIKRQGLSRMSRQHVHLASGVSGSQGVISGMRSSCQLHIHVDIDSAIADGIKFFKSSNGVILTPGDEQGFLKPKYFKKIVDAKTVASRRNTMVAGGGSSGHPVCHICNVTATSYCSLKSHLLGKQHQKKARTAPFAQTGELSTYLSISAASAPAPTKANGSTNAPTKNAPAVPTKKATDSPKKAAASPTKKEAASPTKKEAAAAPVQTTLGDLDLTVTLTTLAHLVRTRTEDEVLSWLSGQLLLTPAQHQQRVRFCQELQNELRAHFRTCLVQAFGSSVSGLGFRGCDLDIYAFIDAHSHGSTLPPDATDRHKVRAVGKVLFRLTHLCTSVVRIPEARVPIVKFRSPRLGDIDCDMSFKDPMSCQNSRLIGWLMQCDPRVRPLTVAIRFWAKRRNLAGGEHHPRRMSSYCLTLLVVTFLQQLRPPVLPTVDWCQAPVEPMLIGPWNAAFAPASVWHTENATPVSRLLRQFFQFCADLPAETVVVCPLMGRILPRAALKDPTAGQGMARPGVWAGFCDLVASGRVEPLADKPLIIQDPMELSFNVARSFDQAGLDRFRLCSRQAVDMPLERLFDEEAMPKVKKIKAAQAAAAAAAVVKAASGAAAQTSSDGRAAAGVSKRSLDAADVSNGEPASRKAKHNSGEQSHEVTSSGASAGDSAVTSTAPASAPTGSDRREGNVTSDPALLRRVLADFDRQPNRIVSLPMESPDGRRSPRSPEERARYAEACARFIEEIFSVVFRFQCNTMKFDGLDLPMNVVRGYTCVAHLPTWEFRKTVASQLVGRKRTLSYETEITERALRAIGSPAPSSQPLASFSCYLVLLEEDQQLRACLYEGETAKAGKNCHNFLERYLPDMCGQCDYMALFGGAER